MDWWQVVILCIVAPFAYTALVYLTAVCWRSGTIVGELRTLDALHRQGKFPTPKESEEDAA